MRKIEKGHKLNNQEIIRTSGTDALAHILAAFGENSSNQIDAQSLEVENPPKASKADENAVHTESFHFAENHHLNAADTASSPGTHKGPAHGSPLVSPIPQGWLVAYWDRNGRLRGGSDDREHGTVQNGFFSGCEWKFHLTNGTVLPATAIASVAETDKKGRWVAAWTVRHHGLDGNRQYFP